MKDYGIPLLNYPIDVSKEFLKQENVIFNASELIDYCADTGSGTIKWLRNERKARMSFNQYMMPYEYCNSWEFPSSAYERDPSLPFNISFINPRTIRIRIDVKKNINRDEQSLMITGDLKEDGSWKSTRGSDCYTYESSYGKLTMGVNPFYLELRDTRGEIITRTNHFSDTKCLMNTDPIPFSFVRLTSDMKYNIAASFTLAHDEMLFGCGESFTRLNKRGQKLVLWTLDAHGAQTKDMYKPIPFFISSKGYGMFVHTSAPLTLDFGCSYDGANVIYTGDDSLDLFIFMGNPKEVLTEYTALTGRSPVPPLWSFGLWMSRITYKSEAEVRETAARFKVHRIPCDVIHIDTGWFENDWICDYKFSVSRFDDVRKMISDLKDQGINISLWQLPYITRNNSLFKECTEKGYAVTDADGKLPTEDAIIDFSNPEAVKWYQELLTSLFEMGIGAIKVDFGEAGPLYGAYKSGKSGFYEHNLYPLRYNKAVSEITKQCTGESIIWARSAWAGSQRYPLHWGGDAENTNSAMAASLRAGLSLGLCGFSFWSHDIGGFVQVSPEELYRRWMPFGMLTSHSRCHGVPPKEPWHYSEGFVEDFRSAVELKYTLMPYIYTQAVISSTAGFPMMRTLFFEFPEDRTAWLIENEYLFGSEMLVAPLFDEKSSRGVYLPIGDWVDYQTGKTYEGGKWHDIEAGDIPCIILVKAGAVIPHIKIASSTGKMDWSEIEVRAYQDEENKAKGYICLPSDGQVQELEIMNGKLINDPFMGNVNWKVSKV